MEVDCSLISEMSMCHKGTTRRQMCLLREQSTQKYQLHQNIKCCKPARGNKEKQAVLQLHWNRTFSCQLQIKKPCDRKHHTSLCDKLQSTLGKYATETYMRASNNISVELFTHWLHIEMEKRNKTYLWQNHALHQMICQYPVVRISRFISPRNQLNGSSNC